MVGARMVLPGPGLDGASIFHMIDAHQVWFLIAGVGFVSLSLNSDVTFCHCSCLLLQELELVSLLLPAMAANTDYTQHHLQ